jgi:type I restriction enzyme M protein
LLNSDTKRHIDAARDVLVGVAPNPTTQIDQITYALIYKFMDDMDQASIKAGGEASFFIGDLKKYAWSNLMSTRMGNQEKMELYSEALTKFSEAKQLPELFRTIFRAAFLPYRSPETLGLFLKEISNFDYTHPEELGNAYEYLLSIMSSQGDAGQFRTPRHIIDFIVDVINPTKDDTVLDPACGTGGFLVSAYNHILEQHDGKDDPNKKEKSLTPDQRKKLMSNLQGYDIDPTMVRIAQVNMYLHQFKNPQIFQYDSLTSEERWNDKYDVILANPPFMTPKGGIKPHNKFGIASNRAEVLFVDYIINHLKPKGRAGIVVPEGIIFQSGKAYKELRKNLVENGLFAVVSLPGGVFQPYSGVKTSILLIDNEIAKQKSEIAFVKISADGFDLGATKRAVSENDLPPALASLQSWAHGKSIENTIITLVSKDEIAEKGDYNLSGNRYTSNPSFINSSWPLVEIGDFATLLTGGTPSSNNPAYYGGSIKWLVSGDIHKGQIFDCDGRITELALKESNAKILPINSVMIALNGQGKTRGTVALLRTIATCNQSLVAISPDENRCIPDYLFYVLRYMYRQIREINGEDQRGGLNMPLIRQIKIPLPPLEVQRQIIAELDGYAAIISGAKQIVENWKPQIDVDPEWNLIPMGEVCDVRDGTHDSPEFLEQGIPLITSKNLIDGVINFSDIKYISEADHQAISKRSKVDDGDLLMAMIGTIGNAVLVRKDREFSIKNVALFKMQKSEKLNNLYLFYLLRSSYIEQNLFSQQKGVTQKFLALGDLRKFPIPVPSLTIQESIVSAIEAEREQVDSAKGLIDNYEARTQAVIAKLWSADE